MSMWFLTAVSIFSPDIILRPFFTTKSYLYFKKLFGCVEFGLETMIDDNKPNDSELDIVMSVNGNRNKAKLEFFGMKRHDYIEIKEELLEELTDLECHIRMRSGANSRTSAIEESNIQLASSFVKSQIAIPGASEEMVGTLEKAIISTLEELQLYCSQCYMRTRVFFERRTITCALRDFLHPGSKRRQTVPVIFPSGSVTLELLMRKRDTVDLLKIKAYLETEPYLHCRLICTIEFLDSGRNVHASEEEKHTFYYFIRPWTFKQTFEWDKIKSMDERSVRVTITLCDGRYLSDVEWSTGMDEGKKLLDLSNDVSKDLSRLFAEKKFCDVVIRVQHETVDAHKAVLCSRSPVFAAMFSCDMKEKDDHVIEIDDLELDTVTEMLHFMYSGSLETSGVENAVKLFTAADKYEIASLMNACRRVLKSQLNDLNICSVLRVADEQQDDELLEHSIPYFAFHRSDILESAEWGELKDSNPSLAINILTRVCLKP